MIDKKIVLSFAFLSLLLMPSFFYVVFAFPSMSFGLFVACIAVILVSLKLDISFSTKKIVSFLFLLIFIVIYQFFTFYVENFPFDHRTIASMVFLLILIFSALIFGGYLFQYQSKTFFNVLPFLVFFSILIGFFAIFFEQSFLGYELYAKSVFPFAEPSHYAITLGPILFASGLLLSLKYRVLILVSFICLGVLLPSLVMMLFSFLMMFFFFKCSIFKKAVFIFIGLFFFYFLFFIEEGAYFLERITFSSESKNLTALVYMQGWSDMFESLEASSFLGVGFQNMGILPPGYYGDLIYSLAGEFKNRNDGGFLAAKLISEFGVLGMLFIIFYIRLFLSSIKLLIRWINTASIDQNAQLSKLSIFASGIIVGFFVELFARGSGYFTSGVFMLLMSSFILYKFYKNTKVAVI
ncbi:MAG: hypothetical protein IBX55_16220 [Methyloprofundus sp.]|nr:hypothetical protein [Methyloprofundus sp.]